MALLEAIQWMFSCFANRYLQPRDTPPLRVGSMSAAEPPAIASALSTFL